MSVGISFSLCSFFFIALLTLVFFGKPRIASSENKIYSLLIVTSLFGTAIGTPCYYFMKYYESFKILNTITARGYLVYLVTWITLFTLYVFMITFKKVNIKKMQNIFKGFYAILIILVCVLPLYYENGDGLVYSYGPAANFMYIASFLAIIGIIVCLIMNIKNITQKKFFPLIAFIIIGTVIMTIQKINPALLLITFGEAYITFLMYFTIENPDVKLINQLNMAKDQAEKANRAKTEFLSSMSHEIRTPLNAIVGFSDCMLTSNNLQETKEFAKDVVDASNNLLEIVNGILDISKIEANKMEIIEKEYNPREVFASLAKLIAPRMKEKALDFKINITEDLPGILRGDMGKVKQIILNLLTNAVKYTDKGEVNFTVTCINRLNTNTCLIYIAVKDTGRGIKKENMDKLFNKFERIDEDKNTTIEGTGLGLAITKRLTEMMGGKITVNSKYEEGSVFRVFLEQTIVSMEVPENNNEEIEIDYDANPGKRILIVDDSKINLKVANQILKPYHFDIVLAESGYEALELMESKTFDLILMDIMMPKMNGIETLRRLKEIEGFNIPVIALTADAIEGNDEKYLRSGFDAYLSKPIDKYHLDKVLKKFLGGSEDE
ncbi:MAG: response regulator [Bacilli bacterium]|nr:response regulator [Bacilli bacterium]